MSHSIASPRLSTVFKSSAASLPFRGIKAGIDMLAAVHSQLNTVKAISRAILCNLFECPIGAAEGREASFHRGFRLLFVAIPVSLSISYCVYDNKQSTLIKRKEVIL